MQPNNPSDEQSSNPVGEQPVSKPVQVHAQQKLDISPFVRIQKITAWVMIGSAILFALIGILAVWEVFGSDTGDVVWRALSSLAIIAFSSLIINVSVRMIEDKRK